MERFTPPPLRYRSLCLRRRDGSAPGDCFCTPPRQLRGLENSTWPTSGLAFHFLSFVWRYGDSSPHFYSRIQHFRSRFWKVFGINFHFSDTVRAACVEQNINNIRHCVPSVRTTTEQNIWSGHSIRLRGANDRCRWNLPFSSVSFCFRFCLISITSHR